MPLCSLGQTVRFVNILLYPAACEASNVMSAKSACVQPGIYGACVQVSVLIMFCAKESVRLDILFFSAQGGGGWFPQK